MAPLAVRHGDARLAQTLIVAVQHNCDCQPQAMTPKRCAAHAAMLGDQRRLDGLLFAWYVREQLLEGESTDD